jgi:hypothetical protein
VFFKHKYITQPTLTLVKTVVKAINNLTSALKGARNVKGMQQIEILKKIDKLLNNIPINLADMLDPPSASQLNTPSPRVKMNTPSPRVEDIRPQPSPQTTQSLPPIKESSETMSEPAPRVQNKKETEKTKEKSTQTRNNSNKTSDMQ